MYRYACEVDYYGVVRLRPYPAINEGAYQRGGLLFLCVCEKILLSIVRTRPAAAERVPLSAQKKTTLKGSQPRVEE